MRAEDDRMRVRDRCGKGVISFGSSLVIEEQVHCNRERSRTLDSVDELRQLLPRPRPLALAAQAVVVDCDDHRWTCYGNRPCEAESEIVGGGIQFRKVWGPGQQQNRDC